ncbi:MAG: hypothetical protein RLZZ535_3161, partial [Cyanobacteriota bacterium]
LVNPNGIIFGENAQLDVGGSFIATTANSIQFEDGADFIASDAESEPILTVSVPIGLQLDGDSGAITVNGNGNQITPDFSSTPTEIETINGARGLSIAPEKTLALIGGDINVSGGTINVNNGRIEIGSVNSGSVSFQPIKNGFSFNFDDVVDYQNIALDHLSSLNASGSDRGDIFLYAANINLRDGSLILIQNQGSLSSGTLDINASDSLTLSGTSSDGNVSSVIRSEATSSGSGANINISTKQLLLRNGGRIGATTYTDADGGDIQISSTNSVQLLENTLVDQNRQGFVVSGISTIAAGDGNGGELRLSTSDLDVTSGASIQTSASRTGNSGSLTVNAKTVDISGINSNSERTTPSALTSSVNSGNAGDFKIDAVELKITNGGTLGSSTFGTGNAGNVSIDVSKSIEVSGENSGLSSRLNSSVVSLTSEAARERLGIPDVPSGRGGNVTLNTSVLNVVQKGQVSVSNEGIGDSGNLVINAEKINLSTNGSIEATSFSGVGGNIDINADRLLLDENSQITATAENNGDGGNVVINTTSLIAKKNSQVTANAFGGRGGNINIDAEGLFLFDSLSNIFSASSELGIDGEIQINTPDINFQKELEQSELEILTVEQAIAGSCLARSNRQGSFTVNNSARLPKSPESNYSDIDSTLTGISSLPATAKQPKAVEESDRQPNVSMLPAERMVKTENGRVFLVAAPYAKRLYHKGTMSEGVLKDTASHIPFRDPLGQGPKFLFCPKN